MQFGVAYRRPGDPEGFGSLHIVGRICSSASHIQISARSDHGEPRYSVCNSGLRTGDPVTRRGSGRSIPSKVLRMIRIVSKFQRDPTTGSGDMRWGACGESGWPTATRTPGGGSSRFRSSKALAPVRIISKFQPDPTTGSRDIAIAIRGCVPETR